MSTVRHFVDLLAKVDLNTAEALTITAVTITVLTILALAARRMKLPGFASVATGAANIVILGTTVEGAMQLAERLLRVTAWADLPRDPVRTIAINIFVKARHHARPTSTGRDGGPGGCT
jgi:hypothetical protein